MITFVVAPRWLPIAALLTLPLAAPTFAQQIPTTSPASAAAPQDPEAENTPAPVLLGGDPIIWITTGAGPYTTQFRAERISQRVESVARDRSIANPTVTVTENEGSSELKSGPRLLMVVTAQDARSLGIARASLAAQYARELESDIRAERLRYAPATLMRSGIYGAIATLALVVSVWAVFWVTRRARNWIDGRWRQRGALRLQQAEIVSADRIGYTLDVIIRAIRALVILLFLDLYLTYTLGLFPWTRAVSRSLVGYVVSPFRMAGAAFLGYLPKLLFVLVIAGIIYFAIRLVGLFFNQIKLGRIVFANFPAERADPTNNAALHARIQDEFYAAGVEIMSPHFTAIRDGNTVAIPEAFRGAGYHAPAFRVEDTTAMREPSPAIGVRRPAPSSGAS